MTNQACEFIELTALLTSHYHLVLESDSVPNPRNVENYWTSSKCRFQRWTRNIKRMEVIQQQDQPDLVDFLWHRIQPTIMEILVSEVLTRVNTGLAMIHDQLTGNKDWIAVAESVFSGHQEARQRTLRLLLSESSPPEEIRRDIERVRRQSERWNDLFLGYLAAQTPMAALAFSPERVEDFADGFRYDQNSPRYSWERLQRGIRRAFGNRRICRLPNNELNDQIMTSLFGIVANASVDHEPTFPALWRMRMSHVADNANAMIEEILNEEVAYDSLV